MNRHKAHEAVSTILAPQAGSDRTFGFVFASVFAVFATWPAIKISWPPEFNPHLLRLWLLALSALFVVVSSLSPALLRPLNRLWSFFGVLLSKVTTPLVMSLVFVVTVVPTGLVRRLLKHDPMRRKFDSEATTYWIMRDPPGPERDSMKNQY